MALGLGLGLGALTGLGGCMPSASAPSALESKLLGIGAYAREQQGTFRPAIDAQVKATVVAKDDAGRCYVIIASERGERAARPELIVQAGPAPVPARQINQERPTAWDFCLATGVKADLTLAGRGGGSDSRITYSVYSVDPDIHQRNYPGVQRPRVAIGGEGGEQITEVHEQGQGGQGGRPGPSPTGAAPVLVVEAPAADSQAAVEALVKGAPTQLLYARRAACAFGGKDEDKQAPSCPPTDQLLGGEPLVAVVPGAAGRVEVPPNQLVQVLAADGSRLFVRAREIESAKPQRVTLPPRARSWRHRPESAMSEILPATLALRPGGEAKLTAALDCEGKARKRHQKDQAEVDANIEGADDYTMKAIKKRTAQLKVGLEKSVKRCYAKVKGGVARRRALINQAGDMLLGLVRGRLGPGT